MSQNDNSSDFTKIVSGAFLSLTGVVKDVKDDFNNRIANYIEKMNLVKREEFDVMQAMLAEMRLEQEQLKMKFVDLEKKLKK